MRCSSCAARCRRHVLEGRDIDRAHDYNRESARHRTVSGGRVEDRRAHPARARAGLLARRRVPAIRRILFKFIPNTNTRINQLKSGEVHVVALVPWDKYRELSAGPASTVSTGRSATAYEHVTLNERQFTPFADVRVRRALAARDRSRADRAHDPRRPGAGGPRPDPAGVVGVHRPVHAVPIRPGAGARAARRGGLEDPSGDGIRASATDSRWRSR